MGIAQLGTMVADTISTINGINALLQALGHVQLLCKHSNIIVSCAQSTWCLNTEVTNLHADFLCHE